MKTRLFDASAIMLIAKNHPEDAPEQLNQEYILDLTLYEIGNAVWKINKLLGKPSREKALETIEQLHRLTALMIRHEALDKQTHTKVMDNALHHGLTYYDSAYLTAAQQLETTLVTTDKKLEDAAKRANIHTMNPATPSTGSQRT